MKTVHSRLINTMQVLNTTAGGRKAKIYHIKKSNVKGEVESCLISSSRTRTLSFPSDSLIFYSQERRLIFQPDVFHLLVLRHDDRNKLNLSKSRRRLHGKGRGIV